MARPKGDKFVNYNRNNIIEVAEKLFSEHGYENVTIDQIKDESNCSKSTLYNYFKNKDQIFNGIVLKGMETCLEYIQEALSSPTYDYNSGNYSKEENEYFSKFFSMCFAVSSLQSKYPMRFEGVCGNIEINAEGESFDVLKRIFDLGETINATVGKFLTEGVELGFLDSSLLFPQTTFTFWGGLLGIIRITSGDDAMIQKRMGVTKSQFLNYSFQTIANSLLKK